jgi:hypothetical protein
MDTAPFAIILAVCHVVLFILVHGNRTRHGTSTRTSRRVNQSFKRKEVP